MFIRFFGRRETRYVLMAILSIYMFLLAWKNYSIWNDEWFTLNAVSQSWEGMWNILADDLVHPPLYYVLLKLFLDLFHLSHLNAILFAKLFSVIWVILLFVWGSKLIERRFGAIPALLFVALLSGNMAVCYSVEIRMYSIAMCFTTLAYLYAGELVSNPDTKKWCLFFVCSLIGAYTNYFSIIALSLIWIWLLIRKWKCSDRYCWWICFGLMTLLYIPWIITFISHAKSVTDYNVPLSLRRIISFFAFPFSCHNRYISIITIVVAAMLSAYIMFVKRDEFAEIGVFSFLWVGVACIISSVAFDKFFIGRYLLPALGVLCAGIAVGTRNLRYRNSILFVICIVDVMALFFIAEVESSDRKYMDNLIRDTESMDEQIFAEKDVLKILRYCVPSTNAEIMPSDLRKGSYFVYFWSDEYFQVKDFEQKQIYDFSERRIDLYEVR